jgi:hypothetical protein
VHREALGLPAITHNTNWRQTTDCGAESGELPQFTVGHGNVQELPKDQLRKYWSYKCYAPGFSHVKHDPTIQLQTTPHDSSKDVKHGMAWVCN